MLVGHQSCFSPSLCLYVATCQARHMDQGYSTLVSARDDRIDFSSFFRITSSSMVKCSEQGMFNPPCNTSLEYWYNLVTVQSIIPPFLRKAEHNSKILCGKCPTVLLSLLTAATASRSCVFPVSLTLHRELVPIFPYIWNPQIMSSTTKLLYVSLLEFTWCRRWRTLVCGSRF